jgi:O-antigen chain-terminating methyltransferase
VATTADIEGIKEEWEDAKKEQSVVQKRVRTLEQRFEPLTSMDHFDFARRYRGDPDAIRKRLHTYAQFFGEVERVLDFGCGRGEFLEICGEMKIGAYGVDSDPDMISHCKLKRVDGIVGNALDHMRELPNRSLDGLFSAQVVEHLTPAELVELIQLASDKLKRGGRIVIETINPDTFSALRWFFLDPTHCQPVPAEMLRFFLEEANFRVEDILHTSPVPEDEKLALLEERLGLEGPTQPELLRVLDENSRRLNDAIFGPQDYAIFAER